MNCANFQVSQGRTRQFVHELGELRIAVSRSSRRFSIDARVRSMRLPTFRRTFAQDLARSGHFHTQAESRYISSMARDGTCGRRTTIARSKQFSFPKNVANDCFLHNQASLAMHFLSHGPAWVASQPPRGEMWSKLSALNDAYGEGVPAPRGTNWWAWEPANLS